ncbi:MAG TPA: hydroxyethylthiazole kinase [Dongiaceae bacterium]|jgi:hydroxyethylthiazole kinase
MLASIFETLPAGIEGIRRRRPLIHNIANLVVANAVANALLALGASPAMVENSEEAADLARMADAVVINLGTVSSDLAAAMRLTTASAAAAGKPWVLDPVAVGVLGYRTRLAGELIANKPAVIRGNASEIAALAGDDGGGGKGVDSTLDTEAALAGARRLAERTGSTVVVSGAIDRITDGERMVAIANGHPIMAQVTGTGCISTALIGAFLPVSPGAFTAAAQAMLTMAVAGEMAAERSEGPGTWSVAFLDVLYSVDGAQILERAKIS